MTQHRAVRGLLTLLCALPLLIGSVGPAAALGIANAAALSNPWTADTSHIGLWTTVMIISGIALVVLLVAMAVLSKKKKRSSKRRRNPLRPEDAQDPQE